MDEHELHLRMVGGGYSCDGSELEECLVVESANPNPPLDWVMFLVMCGRVYGGVPGVQSPTVWIDCRR